MLIETVNSLLDELLLNPKQRRACARFMIWSFCKVHTAADVKKTVLRPVFPTRDDSESLAIVYNWYKRQQLSIPLNVMLWRGIFCYVETESCERASNISGFSKADILYAVGCLEARDIHEVKRCSELDWRKAPISSKARARIIQYVQPVIRRNAQKLLFTTFGDPATTPSDLEAQLVVEALSVIAHYECSRRGKHLVNTVIASLANAQRDMCDSYTAKKRCTTPSELRVVDSITNRSEWTCEYLREPLMIAHDDSSESENPALLSRSTTIDEEIEVRDLVEHVSSKVPRYGRYLRIAVLTDKHNKKFVRWLRKHNKKITTDKLLYSCARAFCKVTPEDIERGRALVAEALGA